MPNDRRADVAGGTFFFTVVTAGRVPNLGTDAARRLLRAAVADCRAARPFDGAWH